MSRSHLDFDDQDIQIISQSTLESKEIMKKAVLAALVTVLALIWAPLHLEADIPTRHAAKTIKPRPHVVLMPKPVEMVQVTTIKSARTRIPMPVHAITPDMVPEIEPVADIDPELKENFGEYFDDYIPDAPPSPENGIYDPNMAGLERPIFVKRIPPKYPHRAVTMKLQGYVLLEAVLGADGTIREIKVIRDLAKGKFGFEEEAMAALKQWTFQPGRLHGKPVDVRMALKIDFQLNR